LEASRVSKDAAPGGGEEPPVTSALASIAAAAAAADDDDDESRVRSALHPDECEELLYFIERNYLSSLSALMYSLKDLLFVAEPASAAVVDISDRFVAEFNRLRQMKDGIVKRAAGASAARRANGSAPGTPDRRRQLSPYHIFMKEYAGLVREEHPELPLGERSSLVAAKWKAMSDEEKAPYVQKAAEVRSQNKTRDDDDDDDGDVIKLTS
jgi:hypothetical protein